MGVGGVENNVVMATLDGLTSVTSVTSVETRMASTIVLCLYTCMYSWIHLLCRLFHVQIVLIYEKMQKKTRILTLRVLLRSARMKVVC